MSSQLHSRGPADVRRSSGIVRPQSPASAFASIASPSGSHRPTLSAGSFVDVAAMKFVAPSPVLAGRRMSAPLILKRRFSSASPSCAKVADMEQEAPQHAFAHPNSSMQAALNALHEHRRLPPLL